MRVLEPVGRALKFGPAPSAGMPTPVTGDDLAAFYAGLMTVALPGTMPSRLTAITCYVPIDALAASQQQVDQDLAVMFYDMTTIHAAGLAQQEYDVEGLRRTSIAQWLARLTVELGRHSSQDQIERRIGVDPCQIGRASCRERV